MAPPRLVSFASFLYTLKKYEDSHCPEYYSYLRQLQFLRKIPDFNKLFFPNHSNIYQFHLEDFELQDQISSRVEYFIHKPSKTPVVIKYIKIPFSEYLPSLLAYKLKQIEIEIRRVRRLKSPYLVQIYGWTIYGDYILVCMEKMSNSLKDVYNKVHFKNGQIPEEPLRKIAFFVIQALILLESQRPKILNRDIKPGNILLKYDGNNMFKLKEVKICDFGTLRELEKSGIVLRIEDMAYKPPEMFLYPKRVYDQRKDVWSLGITMLESVRECQNLFVPSFLAEAKTFGGENNQENYIKEYEKMAKMQNDQLMAILKLLNLTMENQEIQNLKLKRQEEQLLEMKRLLANYEYKLKHQLVPMGYGVTTQRQPEIKIMLDYVQNLKYRFRKLDDHIERVNWLRYKAYPYKNPLGPRSTTQPSDPEISPFVRRCVRFLVYIISWIIYVLMKVAMIIGGIVLVLLPIAICFIYVKYQTRPRIYRTRHINWTYLFEILPKTLANVKTNRL
uniref:mitogen-activated protein kinase kinase n=1 Tax=Acrobeloides nanus TaxID=290746 RepID=A0A914C2Q8_9BILA